MSKVGCIFTVAFRYYDIKSNKVRAKKRPFLIIKEEQGRPPVDLSALPVSSISDSSRINSIYDVKVDRNQNPKLNLSREVSYIRANKVQTINETDLIDKICDDMRDEYPLLYSEISSKVAEYYADVL